MNREEILFEITNKVIYDYLSLVKHIEQLLRFEKDANKINDIKRIAKLCIGSIRYVMEKGWWN